MNRFEYVRPDTLQEALTYLEDEQNARILAGGTDLLHEIKHGIIAPSCLVDIKSIPELSGVREDSKGVTIGATTHLSDIEDHALIQDRFPLLVQAVAEVASPQLRNMGTLCGNICQRPRCWYYRNPEILCLKKGGKRCYAVAGENKYHAVFGGGPCHIALPSDTVPALVALGAELKIASMSDKGKPGERTIPIETRTIPIEDFFVTPKENAHRENILDPKEVAVEVRLPFSSRDSSQSADTRSTFIKVRERGTWDFSLASIALLVTMKDEVVQSASVVLGGVAPYPWRVGWAENVLVNRRLDDDTIGDVVDAATTSSRPMRDNRFKVDLVRNLVSDALNRVQSGHSQAGRSGT